MHRCLKARSMLGLSTALAFALLTSGCGDAAGAEGGSVRGVVALQTVWGNPLASGGVRVEIPGSGGIFAVTAPDGEWELDDVPPGEHDLLFTRAGFGDMQAPGQPVVAGETTTVEDTTYMAQRPAGLAIIDSAYYGTLEDEAFLFVDGHYSVTPPPDALWSVAILFEGTSPSVSPALADHGVSHVSFGAGAATTFTFPLSVERLHTRHPAGTVLYFAARANSSACSCYFDPETDRRVFTNTGPAGNVVQVTLN